MSDTFARLRTSKDFSTDEIDDITAISKDIHTLLQEALTRRKEFALRLIERGVPLDHQDNNGQTALQYALARSETDIVRTLLKAGADPNLVDKYGNNALWTAVMNPKPDYNVIRDLYRSGADATRKNNAGRSSVDMAKIKSNDKLKSIFNIE